MTALLVLSISACTPSQTILDVAKATPEVSVLDLENGIAIAKADGDKDLQACYEDVLAEVKATPSYSFKMNGAFSTLALARQAAREASRPVPSKLHKDCAVILIDAQQTAFKLGLKARGL